MSITVPSAAPWWHCHMRLRLLDRYVLGEELVVVLKILNAPLNFDKLQQKHSPSEQKGWMKLPRFSWEPLGNCSWRLLDSCWSLLKGKAADKCLKAIESLWAIHKGYRKPAGNAQIPAVSQWERRWKCPVAISKNVTISPFISSEELHSCLY